MPDVLTLEVKGLKELEKKMIELGPKLARSALRAALNAGAQIIKKETQTQAPFLTGKLSKKAIYIARVKDDVTEGNETFVVSVRHGRKEQQKDRDAFYWKFLEFGTKFIAARPFLRPAFESKKFEAVKIIQQKLLERLEVLANK